MVFVSLHHSWASRQTDAPGAGENQHGGERALCQLGTVPVPHRLLPAHLQGVSLQRRGLHRPHDHRSQSLPGVPTAGHVADDCCLQGVSVCVFPSVCHLDQSGPCVLNLLILSNLPYKCMFATVCEIFHAVLFTNITNPYNCILCD